MRGIAATGVLSGTLLLMGGGILQHGMATTDAIAVSRTTSVPQPVGRTTVGATTVGATTHSSNLSAADLTDVVAQYCQVCHNDALLTGNLSLSGYDVDAASSAPETTSSVDCHISSASCSTQPSCGKYWGNSFCA